MRLLSRCFSIESVPSRAVALIALSGLPAFGCGRVEPEPAVIYGPYGPDASAPRDAAPPVFDAPVPVFQDAGREAGPDATPVVVTSGGLTVSPCPPPGAPCAGPSCNHCGTDPSITACENLPIDGSGAGALALASSGGSVAVAWSSWPSSGVLHVALLGGDLSFQAGPVCMAAGDANALVAVAATPSGWLVAAENAGGVVIQALTPEAVPAGAAFEIASARVPILASNPGGGPLLAWVGADGDGYATLLGADGTIGETSRVVTGVIEGQFGNATFVGDGFVVALRGDLGATVVHVGLDGSVGQPYSFGSETEYPQVTWDVARNQVSATFNDFASTGLVAETHLTTACAWVADPTPLGTGYYGKSPLTSLEPNMDVIVFPGATGRTGGASYLDLVRWSASGRPARRIATVAPADFLSSYSIVPLGNAVVVGWLTGGPVAGSALTTPNTIGVAVVTP